ncbi:hypothetical protein LINPERHAP2_LOCUS15515, partial [Linum perenne]
LVVDFARCCYSSTASFTQADSPPPRRATGQDRIVGLPLVPRLLVVDFARCCYSSTASFTQADSPPPHQHHHHNECCSNSC